MSGYPFSQSEVDVVEGIRQPVTGPCLKGVVDAAPAGCTATVPEEDRDEPNPLP